MNEQKNKLTEKEIKLIEETEAFMDEVYDNPDVAEAEPPVNLRDSVFAEIRAREAERREMELKAEKLNVQEEEAKAEKLDVEEEEAKAEKFSTEEKEPEAEKLTVEEKELIRLGRIYKKRRKLQKYVVLAAVLILALAFGMTSIGGPKKVFEVVKYALTGHEQINVDSRSGDVIPVTSMSEEEVYLEIEETFGFVPVGFHYLPNGIGFLEADIGEEIQCINLVYGNENDVKIAYIIRPNYRVSSYGKDVEDEFSEEYIKESEYATIYIRKYMLGENEERWSVQFEYKQTLYTMSITDTSKEEVEKIVENLYFS